MYNKVKNWYFFPFLLALYPILFLFGNNVSELQPSMAIRVIVLALICTLILLVLFRLIMSGWEVASYVTALVVLILLSYGHIYHSLRDLIPGSSQIIRHRFLFPSIVIVVILLIRIIDRNRQKLSAISPLFNFISLALLVLPTFQIVNSGVLFQGISSTRTERDSFACNLSAQDIQAVPDIYYIILDAYSREDILGEIYNFDNSQFLNQLRDNGFFIAENSQSNYGATVFSLRSSLNLDYIVDHRQPWEDNENVDDLDKRDYSIADNTVRRELSCIGYSVISFDSGYPYTSWRDADYFLSPHTIGWERYYFAGVNQFESMFLYNTIALLIIDADIVQTRNLKEIVDAPYSQHRERILFSLDFEKSGVLNLPSPKFVFAHVVSPHSPYIFSLSEDSLQQSGAFNLSESDGLSEEEIIFGYWRQVEYLNVKVLDMVESILKGSENPPIIIIQGDHGAPEDPYDHMAILNAYHLPGTGNEKLYPGITPVNSFRIIFNHFLGGNYPLLDDHSYFSNHNDYNFVEIRIPAD